jgi:glycosyltransferase involved in cell wall biosynthesis
MQNRDIVITGLQSWNIGIGSNCKNIAIEFSKNNRVLYVNPPIDRISAIKSFIKTKKPNSSIPDLSEVKENLWVFNPKSKIESISSLPVNFLFDLINKHNNKVFAREIKKAIDKLGFKNYIHFCDSDIFRSFYLKDLLKPSLYIYYTRDNLLAVKYWQTQGRRIEPQHMANADLVVANSSYLAKLASVYNPNSHFVGQGCDLTAFKPGNFNDLPADIAKIPNPVIGYIGALKTLRLNIYVIEHIAAAKPEWNIVLIGPEDDTFKKSKLHLMKNVWFLGSKKESELPAYLNAFDVAINPQIVNEVTRGNYPRKIDEYLAMGKPVVATQTEAMDYFSEFVSLATSNTEWVESIEKELKNDNEELQEKRMSYAAEHTWEKNVSEIYKCISNTKNNGHQG